MPSFAFFIIVIRCWRIVNYRLYGKGFSLCVCYYSPSYALILKRDILRFYDQIFTTHQHIATFEHAKNENKCVLFFTTWQPFCHFTKCHGMSFACCSYARLACDQYSSWCTTILWNDLPDSDLVFINDFDYDPKIPFNGNEYSCHLRLAIFYTFLCLITWS